MSILRVDGLASGYGQIPILADITFQVGDGEFVGILGHNGMGKSTLLKTLIGEIVPTSGHIFIAGREVTKLRPTFRARAGVGYVPQGRRIFPALTVRENLRMGAIGANQPQSTIDEVLTELPRLVPILDRAGGVLSGGEQQILALGRALCGRPKLLLLDEPTEGIQPSIRDEIVESLLALRPKRGLSLVVVEQNLEFIRELSDRILIIQKGRIIDEISPDRVMSPEVVAQLVGMSA